MYSTQLACTLTHRQIVLVVRRIRMTTFVNRVQYGYTYDSIYSDISAFLCFFGVALCGYELSMRSHNQLFEKIFVFFFWCAHIYCVAYASCRAT